MASWGVGEPHDGRSGLVRRVSEQARIDRFLDRLTRGPAALGLTGPPGIGKTSLLEELDRRARALGFAVAVIRAGEPEARVAHAGLRDLIGQLDDAIDGHLPEPQRRALRIAVAEDVGDEGTPEASALALRAGVLGVLERSTRERPLLVAVDDLHWLDASTAELLTYAARRARSRLGFAYTRRATELAPDGPVDLGDHTSSWEVPPMAPDELHVLIHQRSDRHLDRSEVAAIVALSEGNPFVAIELAAAAQRDGVLPRSLDALGSARLAGLDRGELAVLQLASAAPDPQIAMLRQAIHDPTAVDQAIRAGEEAGAIEIAAGAIRFAHPLIRHATYTSMTPAERRSVHRALADVALRPEQRARHLALAAVVPDDELLDALDRASVEAARRGASSEAAGFLDLALQVGPEAEGRALRQVTAAELRLTAGDARQATDLVSGLLDGGPDSASPPAPVLARALAVRASAAQLEGDLTGAAAAFEQVIRSTAEPAVQSASTLSLVFLLTNTGQLPQARTLIEEAERNAARIPREHRAALEATSTMVRYLAGDPIDWERVDRALDTTEADRAAAGTASVPPTSHPLLVGALLLHMAGRLTDAAACCERLQTELRNDGDEAALAIIDFWVAWIWGPLGDLDLLAEKVADAERRAIAFGSPGRMGAAHTAAATLAAWRGDADRCLDEVDAAMAALGPGSPPSVWAVAAAGLLELGRGDHAAALDRYGPLVEVAHMMGVTQPTAAWWTPELIEVFAGLGRAEEARALLEHYDLTALGERATEAHAAAVRCAGLVAAAEGDADAGERLLRQALAQDPAGPGSLSGARTSLLLGSLLRRQGRRREARAVLEPALGTFESVGATGWGGRTQAELDRLGLRPRPGASLTPAESAVARLVGDGLTNKEVATRLHISPKTVEAHLTRTYRKVGARSRVELAAAVARSPSLFSD